MQLDHDEFIYRIGKLQLAPNDVVLLKCTVMLTAEQVQQFREHAEQAFRLAGFDNKIVLLTDAVDLQIIEKQNV